MLAQAKQLFIFTEKLHQIGAIDGKHIVVQAPKNNRSLYFDITREHSLSF